MVSCWTEPIRVPLAVVTQALTGTRPWATAARRTDTVALAWAAMSTGAPGSMTTRRPLPGARTARTPVTGSSRELTTVSCRTPSSARKFVVCGVTVTPSVRVAVACSSSPSTTSRPAGSARHRVLVTCAGRSVRRAMVGLSLPKSSAKAVIVARWSRIRVRREASSPEPVPEPDPAPVPEPVPEPVPLPALGTPARVTGADGSSRAVGNGGAASSPGPGRKALSQLTVRTQGTWAVASRKRDMTSGATVASNPRGGTTRKVRAIDGRSPSRATVWAMNC